MMYDSKFVLAVLHNGSPVREFGNTISLPYHSNYKVRVKNKHSFLRAKARVGIDGRQVSNLGDFILKPNEALDLERFVDHSMSSGNKFKFVPLSDGRINDPTDPENGIIKVEFYREKQYSPRPPIRPMIKNGFISTNPTWQYDINRINTFHSPAINTGGGGTTTCSINYVSNSNTTCDSYLPADGAGATIEGGYSGQGFVYGDDFPTEPYPVTLELRIRGLDHREMN